MCLLWSRCKAFTTVKEHMILYYDLIDTTGPRVRYLFLIHVLRFLSLETPNDKSKYSYSRAQL